MILIFTNNYYIENLEFIGKSFCNDKTFIFLKSNLDPILYSCNVEETNWLGNIKSNSQIMLLVNDDKTNKIKEIVNALKEFISINQMDKVYIRYHNRTNKSFNHLTNEINTKGLAIDKSHNNEDISDPFAYIKQFIDGCKTYQTIIESTFSREALQLEKQKELFKVYEDYVVNGNFKFNKANLDEVILFNNKIDKIQIDFNL